MCFFEQPVYDERMMLDRSRSGPVNITFEVGCESLETKVLDS